MQYDNITHHVQRLVASLGLDSLALAGSLRATLHLLSGEIAQITTGRSITTLSMALLASESELGILLLALRATGAITTAITAAALLGLSSLFNGNVEHIISVVGGGRAISLALCVGVVMLAIAPFS